MLWLISDVDTEFDYLRPGFRGEWKINHGLTVGVPELLEFFSRWDLRATFHIQEQSDPEYSILNKYPEVYEMVEDHGQEVSLHVHVMEEDYESRKTEISTGYYRLKEQGYDINSFRAGWYFTNENSVAVLERLGIKYDCSPYKNHPVGPMNWSRVPNSPYHPDIEDVTKVGNSEVLMIPVTDWRLGIAIHRDDEKELELMKKGVEALVTASEEVDQPVILFFTTHSWKPVELRSSSLRKWEVERREKFMEFLSQFEYKTMTVSEAGELWSEGNYSPYWLNLPDIVGPTMPVHWLSRYPWLSRNLVPLIRSIKYKLSGEL